MPRNPHAIAPERQRRFDRALHALAVLCPGRERRVSDFKSVPLSPDPLEIERARWLLVAMAISRGTAGGAAMAAILRRGYAITSDHSLCRQPGSVLPVDTPGLLHLGRVLPSRLVRWKRFEQRALTINPMQLLEHRWCSAHETLRVVADLHREGYHLDAAVPHHEAQTRSAG
jgi:hypothetical protein